MRTNTTVSVKGNLGTNHTSELHIGGDAYGCDTEKEKAFRKLLQQQTKCLVPCRICYDSRLSCLFIVAYPDPLVNLSSKKTKDVKKKMKIPQVAEKGLLAVMNNLFYDGFNSKLIETAFFEGFLEIPILETPKEIVIPSVAIPFSRRKTITDASEEMLVFYEQDPEFREFVSIPQNYIDELKDIQIVSTPDCSLYRDMPLWEQIANIGVSRSVGHYWQQQGKYVIPNARWGDERTYTKGIFDYIPAFSGIPKNSVVSIGTYGCSKSKEDKYYLEAGLEAMLTELTPQDVIVYGSYNPRIFGKYERYTRFHHLPDWTTYVHKRKKVV